MLHQGEPRQVSPVDPGLVIPAIADSFFCLTRLVAVKILNRDHDRDLKNQAHHIGILKKIAASRQNPGYFGHNNIVEFYKEIRLDIDRMGYVHEPLSISLAQAVSEGLLPLPMPMGLVARTVMGVVSGLKFLHDEMKLVYAGELFRLLLSIWLEHRLITVLDVRAMSTNRAGDAKHSLPSGRLAQRDELETNATTLQLSERRIALG